MKKLLGLILCSAMSETLYSSRTVIKDPTAVRLNFSTPGGEKSAKTGRAIRCWLELPRDVSLKKIKELIKTYRLLFKGEFTARLLNAQNDLGENALHCLIKKGLTPEDNVFIKLADEGVSLSHKDTSGYTPLQRHALRCWFSLSKESSVAELESMIHRFTASDIPCFERKSDLIDIIIDDEGNTLMHKLLLEDASLDENGLIYALRIVHKADMSICNDEGDSVESLFFMRSWFAVNKNSSVEKLRELLTQYIKKHGKIDTLLALTDHQGKTLLHRLKAEGCGDGDPLVGILCTDQPAHLKNSWSSSKKMMIGSIVALLGGLGIHTISRRLKKKVQLEAEDLFDPLAFRSRPIDPPEESPEQ